MKRGFRGHSSGANTFRYATRFPTAYVLERETNLLKSMKNLTQNSITKLDCGLSVVNLGMKIEPPDNTSDLLFVRDFYPDLLQDIRKSYYSILIGNPGISKSYFQYYYMMRIFNPTLFGPLPPDWFGSCDFPEIIARQISGDRIQVYDRLRESVYKLPENSDIFDHLDPNKSLYFMEPGTAKSEPYLTDIPTLITVSPETNRRYKQFEKKSATERYYMPCYSLEELLGLGQYMRENNRVPRDMENYYTKEGIEQSFAQFGGNMRHVFPRSMSKIDVATLYQSSAIQDVINKNQAQSILNARTLEHQQVSDYIAQYEVPKKTEGDQIRFRNPTLNLASRQVYNQLENAFFNISKIEMIETLIRNDETGCMNDVYPKFYEMLIAEKLTSREGLTCQQQEFNFLNVDKRKTTGEGESNATNESQSKVPDVYACKLETLQIGTPPSYAKMIPNTLYYPTKCNFPSVEFFYKNTEGNLVAFQVTRQREGVKLISRSAFSKFLKEIDFPEEREQVETKVKLIFIPGPKQADTMHLKIDPSSSSTANSLDLIKTYTVLKIDTKYDQLKCNRTKLN